MCTRDTNDGDTNKTFFSAPSKTWNKRQCPSEFLLVLYSLCINRLIGIFCCLESFFQSLNAFKVMTRQSWSGTIACSVSTQSVPVREELEMTTTAVGLTKEHFPPSPHLVCCALLMKKFLVRWKSVLLLDCNSQVRCIEYMNFWHSRSGNQSKYSLKHDYSRPHIIG